MQFTKDENIHPLFIIFNEALQQATTGKGEAHFGKGHDFIEQPWLHYAKTHGIGFLTGQAVKKIEEAAMNIDTMTHEEWEKEMLNAIVYAGMAIMFKNMRHIALIEANPGVPASLLNPSKAA